MSLELAHHLAHKIFIGTEDGKRLLDALKKIDVENVVFPQSPEVMEQFGGALGWANFRAGQRNFLASIEDMAKQHEQQVEAHNKK